MKRRIRLIESFEFWESMHGMLKPYYDNPNSWVNKIGKNGK